MYAGASYNAGLILQCFSGCMCVCVCFCVCSLMPISVRKIDKYRRKFLNCQNAIIHSIYAEGYYIYITVPGLNGPKLNQFPFSNASVLETIQTDSREIYHICHKFCSVFLKFSSVKKLKTDLHPYPSIKPIIII